MGQLLEITGHRFVSVPLLTATLLIAAILPPTASVSSDPSRDDLNPELLSLIERIARSEIPAATGDLRPPDAPDQASPYSRLIAQTQALNAILDSSSGQNARALEAASAHLTDAAAAFGQTAPGPRGGQNRDVFEEIAKAQRALARADRRTVSPDVSDALHRMRAELASIARQIAANAIAAAERAGGSAFALRRAHAAFARGEAFAAQGGYTLAVVQFGSGFKAAADTLVFDPDLFEQNIVAALAGETVGYAYAIALNGVLYSADHSGLARAESDPPQTPQSPTKEMFVASMSKTISALALLKLLNDEGISVEASISGYLPPAWQQGANVDDVTFRRLLTHRSGLDAGGASCCAASGQTLAALQGFIAAGSTGASDNQVSEYTNANYSLTRVLIPQIAYGEGVISELAGMFPLDAVYAALYASYVTENVLEPAGIAATVCASDEAEDTRTLLYTSPTPNDPGLDPGDWSLSCGAAGWHLSAVQLLRLLAFVRFSEVVISAATRELMDDLYLGWLDPTAFAGYVQSTILPLVYRGHGGDFVGMTGCMMNYHITVQVSLVINSTGGDLGGHACALLRNAFDNAWVAN